VTKLIITLFLSLLLTACFEETESIEPESMADCIEIKNLNERDLCKLKMEEKTTEAMKLQTELLKKRKLESIGDGEINNIDW
jgi:hypothetical protein|tara:strand:- start:24902 stop:25147 length:246 start_codon:yes stop_codon:yes gene_type:complete